MREEIIIYMQQTHLMEMIWPAFILMLLLSIWKNQRRKVNITDLGSNHINLRQVYLTALARSRYNLYITNGYFGY